MAQLFIHHRQYPVRGLFKISRSALSEIDVVEIEIRDGTFSGRAECRPYARYNDNVTSVTAQLKSVSERLLDFISAPDRIKEALPHGPAMNALDCALLDLQAKREGRRAWEILGIDAPIPRETAYTLSVNTPAKMAAAAQTAKRYPVLKLKIGTEDSLECLKAVAHARPDAQLIVDANEALTAAELPEFCAQIEDLRIAMMEQPLPAGHDGRLPETNIRFCADESLHTASDLRALKTAGYGAVNVKLDKCGGVREAAKLMQIAGEMGFTVMAGCMVGSSLAMAPMAILESLADHIDLDGPLLLKRDIENGLEYTGPMMSPPRAALWG